MSTQRLNGAFDQNFPSLTFVDGVIGEELRFTPAGPSWSSGAVRTAPIQIQPSLMEHWSLLGFSVRARAATRTVGHDAPAPWGYLGDIWAGVLVDSSIQDATVANLPQDLSTFTKLLDGQNDQLPQVASATAQATGLLATTYMLPTPLDVHSGTQLQMGLVLTPSLINTNSLLFAIFVQAADYTLLYDDGKD